MSIFDEIGEIKDSEYEFKLKSDYQGKIEPCRKVPFKILDAYKEELDKMEREQIISKIDEPTEFVSSAAIVKKPNGTLRVCIDPQYLNSCLMREHLKLSSFEEISSKMVNAKDFTILDCSRAFYQIKLTEKSAKLTTFNTPFGRYYYKRLPYGVSIAPDIFHKKYKKIFGNID